MSKPTQAEIYDAFKAARETRERYVTMCREVVAGLRRYTVDELKCAAEACIRAHDAFRRVMAPLSGYGPRLN